MNTITIKTLIPLGFGSNCYLVCDDQACILIDPSCDVYTIEESLGDKKLQAVFLTHSHFDHVLYLDEVIKHFKIPLYTHENGLEKISNPKLNYSIFTEKPIKIDYSNYEMVLLQDEMIIADLLKQDIKIITTPGHTNCSVMILVDKYLFTGDTLFKDSIGRTDLYSANINEMYKSLEKVSKLNSGYIIYPGHGQISKLSDEFKNNPYLKP